MTVHMEFFGIPRSRAGVAHLDVEADSLQQALNAVAAQIPGWGTACLAEQGLQKGLIANLNGQRFVTDPATPLQPGDSVLILSADVGG